MFNREEPRKSLKTSDVGGQFWQSENRLGLQDLHVRRCGSGHQTSGWEDGIEAQAKAADVRPSRFAF